MNWIQKTLMLCSGANLHILRKTPSEWNKYSGIGGIVLFTGVFAFFSAGYAIYTVFEQVVVSVLVGILWGLMIFNLDRYIVSSIKKTSSWKNQLLMSIPRFILAIFLGVIISKPLELKIFEKEINKQLNTIVQRNKSDLEKQMSARITNHTAPFVQEKQKIEQQIDQYQKIYDSSVVDLERELLGKQTDLTSGKAGYGSHAKRKEQIKNQRKKELEDYQSQMKPRLSYLDEQISKIYSDLSIESKKNEKVEERFNGLMARLQALDELGEKPIMAMVSLLVTLLFVILEISPVLVKLISPAGPYDFLLDKIENDFRVYSKEKIEKTNLLTDYRVKQYRKNLED